MSAAPAVDHEERFDGALNRQGGRAGDGPKGDFGPLRGVSPAMRELFANLKCVAACEATVLITGETGTGKELVARAVHEASRRASRPFVVVDCASLPETLLDAELFGHTRGAFTGANAARAGAFEAADGGSLFLDEIGELPLALQPKLLRVLEARTVRRVGQNHQRPVDVRFLAATHRDLRALVDAGQFREDLYFRLAVLPVRVPALRERLSDLPLLVRHFLPVSAHASLTAAILTNLTSRPWRGNVRELRNFVDRLLALGPAHALALGARESPAPATAPESPVPPFDWSGIPLSQARRQHADQFEREYVAALLDRHGHNVSAAARAAAVNRTYLHRLIRRYGLSSPPGERSGSASAVSFAAGAAG